MPGGSYSLYQLCLSLSFLYNISISTIYRAQAFVLDAGPHGFEAKLRYAPASQIVLFNLC